MRAHPRGQPDAFVVLVDEPDPVVEVELDPLPAVLVVDELLVGTERDGVDVGVVTGATPFGLVMRKSDTALRADAGGLAGTVPFGTKAIVMS